MVVSRCLGIGTPSGIPSLGRCFCWPTNFVASHTPPSLYCLIPIQPPKAFGVPTSAIPEYSTGPTAGGGAQGCSERIDP